MRRFRRPENLRRWLRPAVPLVVLLAACVVTAVLLSSCRTLEPPATVPSRPLRLDGVPTIRVRLTPRPVETVGLATTGAYHILLDGDPTGRSSRRMEKTLCRRSEGTWTLGMLTARGKTLSIIPEGSGYVRIGPRVYRGRVVLVADGPGRFFVHNHVDMESYLASVVAKELYPNFHPETYHAQAIAARGYALYEVATRGQRSSFDVWDSQRSQVYGGLLAETDRSWDAVRGTHACVLAYGSPGNERIFLTQFSACNGGYVNGAEVIRRLQPGEKIPPLAGGQKDDDGRNCPHYAWGAVLIAKNDLYRVLRRQYENIRKLGNIKELKVSSSTPYGRPIWLEAVNAAGQAVPIRAEDVRLCLLRSELPEAKGLYSMNCRLRDAGNAIEFYDGRGFGHGVGLSQWGAEEKAQCGMTAEAILRFYYPGATIFRAY